MTTVLRPPLLSSQNSQGIRAPVRPTQVTEIDGRDGAKRSCVTMLCSPDQPLRIHRKPKWKGRVVYWRATPCHQRHQESKRGFGGVTCGMKPSPLPHGRWDMVQQQIALEPARRSRQVRPGVVNGIQDVDILGICHLAALEVHYCSLLGRGVPPTPVKRKVYVKR